MGFTPSPNTTSTLKLRLGYVGGLNITAFGFNVTGWGLPAGQTLTSADVGCPVTIIGAGALGGLHVTTIVSVSGPGACSLANAALTTVTADTPNGIIFRAISAESGSIEYDSSLTVRDTLKFKAGAFGDPGGSYGLTALPFQGQPVMLIDDVIGAIFGGTVDQVELDNLPGSQRASSNLNLIMVTCSCVSWDLLLYKRVIPGQTFSNMTLDAIFQAIHDTGVGIGFSLYDDGIGLSLITGPTIPSVSSIKYDTVGNWFDNLCTLASGTDVWYWYTTPYRVVVLAKQTTTAAPFNVDDSDLSDGNVLVHIKDTETREQYLNRAYVHLGQSLTGGSVVDTFAGDSVKTVFYTTHPVGATPTIDVNGVMKTVGVLGSDTGKDWYWNQDSTVITQDAGGTVLTSAQNLHITYQYNINPIFLYSDDTEVGNRAALESGTGYYEQVFDAASTGPGANDGQAQAQATVLQYGKVPSRFEIETYRSGLAIGQMIHIELSDFGVNDDFLIDSVVLTSQDNLSLWKATAIKGSLINWDWRSTLGGSSAGSISGVGGGGGGSGPLGLARKITASSTQLSTDDLVECDTSTITQPTALTLGAAITTTPAPGTQEVITLSSSGAGTVNGTDTLCGTERMRIISGALTATPTVERGASGTTPATHSNGAAVTLPGGLIFTLLVNTSVPDHRLAIKKISTDINYVKVVANAANTFDSGATFVILPDQFDATGLVVILFPPDSTVLIRLSGAGSGGVGGDLSSLWLDSGTFLHSSNTHPVLVGISTTDVVFSGVGGLLTSNAIVSVTAASNASVGSFAAIAGNYVALSSNKTNSGTLLPIAVFMGATRAITVDVTAKVGIGTTSPSALLSVNTGGVGVNNATGLAVQSTSSLATTLDAMNYAVEFMGNSGDNDRLLFVQHRTLAGSSWTTSAWRIQPTVDASFSGVSGNRGYIELAYGTSGLYSGIGLSGKGNINPDFILTSGGNVLVNHISDDGTGAPVQVLGSVSLTGNTSVSTYFARLLLDTATGQTPGSATTGLGGDSFIVDAYGCEGNVFRVKGRWSQAQGDYFDLTRINLAGTNALPEHEVHFRDSGNNVLWKYTNTIGIATLGTHTWNGFTDIEIGTDVLNVGSGFVLASLINHFYGGTGMRGGRQSLSVNSYLVGPSDAGSPFNRQYEAISAQCNAQSSDRGTALTPLGSIFALGAEAVLTSAAQHMFALLACEMNTAAQTGSSVAIKEILALSGRPDDAVRGASYDSMLALSNATGAVTWTDGILISDAHGAFPINATFGTIMRTIGGTVLNGIDFSSSTISGSAFLVGTSSSGCVIHGDGGIFVQGAGGSAPMGYNNTTAPTDDKVWASAVSGNSLLFYVTSDTGASSLVWMEVNRSAVTVPSISLTPGSVFVGATSDDGSGAKLQVLGAVNVSGLIQSYATGASLAFQANSGTFIVSGAGAVSAVGPLDIAGSGFFGLTSTDVSLSTSALIVKGVFVSVTASTNASVASLAAIAGNYVSLSSFATGSGTQLPLVFFVNGAERVRMLTNGATLFGFTSTDLSLLPGSIVSADGIIAADTATNCSCLALGITTGAGADLSSGKTGTGALLPIRFFLNPNERMRLLPAGQLLVGLTSTDASLSAGAIVSINSFVSVTASTNASVGSFAAIASTYIAVSSGRTGAGTFLPMAFFTNNAEAMRITTTSLIYLGRTSDDGSGLRLQVTGGISVDTNVLLNSGYFSVGGHIGLTESLTASLANGTRQFRGGILTA
jgi:hypothetical protein